VPHAPAELYASLVTVVTAFKAIYAPLVLQELISQDRLATVKIAYYE